MKLVADRVVNIRKSEGRKWFGLAALCLFIWAFSAAGQGTKPPIVATIPEFIANARTWGESNRVVLTGVVSHSTSDGTFFIQDAGIGAYVFFRPVPPLSVGDFVEVTANPSLGGMVPTLQNASVKKLGRMQPPAAIRLTAEEMARPTNSMKLVTLRGRLQEKRLNNGRTLIVDSEEGAFSIETEALPDIEPLNQFPANCVLDATGVLTLRTGPKNEPAGVRLLIRSASDLIIVQGPPFWNRRRMQLAAIACGLGLIFAGAWVALLRREIKKQTGLISQRLEREAALAASENRFLKVFNASPDPVVIVRASDEKIIDVNPAFERVTGYGKGEAIGRTTRELDVWADNKERSEILAEFRQGKSVVNVPFDARRKDGRIINLLASMEWIEVNGEKCWMSMVRDITAQTEAEEERRRIESTLIESQKLEALGTLAGGIAHDFNNILAAILSNAEMAGATEKPSAEDSEYHLAQIRQAAMRARELVNQILAFSRGQPQKIRRRTVLQETALEAARLLRSVTPAGIRIETNLRPSCAAVMADPGAILQVIVNLGINGVHAMERRPGTLTISLDPARVDSALSKQNSKLTPGDYVCLRVTDEGDGIDGETLRRIFDPFFTTKAPGKGTGLGLAVVQTTVNEHGGAILVESKVGAGSTFSVYLPSAAGSSESEPEPEQPSTTEIPRGAGEKVLIVDDDVQLRSVMERIVKSLGYDVTVMENPHDALKYLQNENGKSDLLITDLNMPGISGLDLISKLRTTHPQLPIILLSGYITDTTDENCVGPTQKLLKPVTRDELAVAMAKSLEKAVPRS